MLSSMAKMIHFLRSGLNWEVELCNEFSLPELVVRSRTSGSMFKPGVIDIKFLGFVKPG